MATARKGRTECAVHQEKSPISARLNSWRTEKTPLGNSLSNAKEIASGEALAMAIKENKSAITEKNNLSTGLFQHNAMM